MSKIIQIAVTSDDYGDNHVVALTDKGEVFVAECFNATPNWEPVKLPPSCTADPEPIKPMLPAAAAEPAPADPVVEAGEGWRLLGPDEVMQAGDEWKWSDEPNWTKVFGLAGQTCRSWNEWKRGDHTFYARRPTPTATPAPAPTTEPEDPRNPKSPGEGYRFLEGHETIREGDEFKLSRGWVACQSSIGHLVSQESVLQPIRRKLDSEWRMLQVGEIIKEGDEVLEEAGWGPVRFSVGCEIDPEDVGSWRRRV